ncbi:MAG: amidohydrolase family protein [Negativicutes bacterium]|nr:amidohydrolase family protein [Negativicutes bacterium]
MVETVLRNVRLIEKEGLFSVTVADGKIAAVLKGTGEEPGPGVQVTDCGGNLLTPAFIDCHVHLDKTNIVDVVRPNQSGTLKEAIEIIWEKKRTYTVEDIVERASRTVELGISHGTTRFRTHVDVDSIGGLLPLRGLVEVRKKYAGVVDIQIVAFPQEGIIQDEGTEKLMWQAMEEGADVVGGMPANEKSPRDSRRHVEIAFDIAKAFNADVCMHVDETDDPFYRTLEMVIDKTAECGWQGRVTAGHTCALAAYDDHYANYVMAKAKEAQVNFITNPVTNLMLQGRLDRQPKRRGITRVKELLQQGLVVAMGQDCVRDTFYPFGKEDMLEVALIGAHAAHMSLPEEIRTVFDMCTINAAKILRIEDQYGVKPGARADLTLLNCTNVVDAIRLQPLRLLVMREGKTLISRL